MRQKIISAGQAIVGSIKSPLGLTIVGGIAGSSATYFFSRTKLAQDLVQAQTDKQQLLERVLKLENENSDIFKQTRELLIINTGHQIKSDELRDELRLTGKEIAMIGSRLNDCKHNISVVETAFKNSWCFWKSHVYQDRNAVVNSDHRLTDASVSKNEDHYETRNKYASEC